MIASPPKKHGGKPFPKGESHPNYAPVAERLFSKIIATSLLGCWDWSGAKHKFGYGRLAENYVEGTAHRTMWKVLFGDPGDLEVLHRCDNPPCCNPFHLFLGTQRDNIRDASKKGRLRIGEEMHNAILTRVQVLEIKQLRSEGLRIGDLAVRYGVSRGAIRGILSGLTWKHLL